jgi:hypothetical protein
MILNELAYRQGSSDALEKFAGGQMFAPSAPPKPPVAGSPVSSVMTQKPPAPIGGSAPAPVVPPGMPAASAATAPQAMGPAGSPVLGTGMAPPPNPAAQTAAAGAARTFASHGAGQ